MTRDEWKRLPRGPTYVDVLLSVANAGSVARNALATHYPTLDIDWDVLAMEVAEPLLPLIDSDELPHEAVVHILMTAALLVQGRYGLVLRQMQSEISNGEHK